MHLLCSKCYTVPINKYNKYALLALINKRKIENKSYIKAFICVNTVHGNLHMNSYTDSVCTLHYINTYMSRHQRRRTKSNSVPVGSLFVKVLRVKADLLDPELLIQHLISEFSLHLASSSYSSRAAKLVPTSQSRHF